MVTTGRSSLDFSPGHLGWLYGVSLLLVWMLLLESCKRSENPPANQSQPDLHALKIELSTTRDVYKRMEINLIFAQNLLHRDPDSALIFLNKAHSYYKDVHSLAILGRYFEIKGDLAQKNGNKEAAKRDYLKALFCYEKTGQKRDQMIILNNLGVSYSENDYAKAFSNYIRCRDIARELNDMEMVGKLNNNIARIYVFAGNFSAGIENFMKAKDVFEQRADSFRFATVYMNLSNAFNHLEQFDSSRKYLDKAIAVYEATGKKFYLGSCLGISSYIFMLNKQYDKALEYQEKVLAIAREGGSGHKKTESRYLMSDVLYLKGMTYFYIGNYTTARENLLRGLSLADSMGLEDRKLKTCNFLSQVYEKTGQIDSAYYYKKIFIAETDSARTINAKQGLEILEINFRYQQTQQELEEKNLRQRLIFIGSIILLTFFIFLLILLFRQQRIRIRQDKLEKKLLNEELERRNRELASHVLNMVRMNERKIALIQSLKEQLPYLKKENQHILERVIDGFENDQDPQVWKEFEMRFTEVHSDFYNKLTNRFPDITLNEKRLCAFLLLNMTTKEICSITGQSTNAIEQARIRLRKKMGLANQNISISNFLSNL